jgi:hypothetical protein
MDREPTLLDKITGGPRLPWYRFRLILILFAVILVAASVTGKL